MKVPTLLGLPASREKLPAGLFFRRLSSTDVSLEERVSMSMQEIALVESRVQTTLCPVSTVLSYISSTLSVDYPSMCFSS